MPFTRRQFLLTSAGAAAAAVVALVPGVLARARPEPERYLARSREGAWGVSTDPDAEEAVLLRGPGGVVGIAGRGAAGALRPVMEGGVVGISAGR